MIFPNSHVSYISKSGASLSHWKKSPNSLSTEDEDLAPVMGSSSTVTACMSQVDYLLLLDLLSFDPPPELLVFLAPTPKLLLFTKKPAASRSVLMHSFGIQPGERPVRDCALWQGGERIPRGPDPRDDEPVAVRDGMRRTNLFDIPTCVSHNYARVSSGLVKR
ncbi:hypothetical protein F2Q69_00033461 [Brassica cretica]|uniref:Uncharacterized protein n=1 Tax=Brassica cretica TaxID=69181 RepID=A0A8S9SGC1_BRACR|nr:hypothetical protein F2Q69_00033461 [Brassica cretica]